MRAAPHNAGLQCGAIGCRRAAVVACDLTAVGSTEIAANARSNRWLKLAQQLAIPWEQARCLQALAWASRRADDTQTMRKPAQALADQAQAIWRTMGVPEPALNLALDRDDGR